MSPVVRYTARRLSEDLRHAPSSVEQHLVNYFVTSGIGRPNMAEMRSWNASLPELAHLLSDAGLGNVEVLLEHRLPLTSRRADAVLAGTNPHTGHNQYVVVELKQWSKARVLQDFNNLVEVDGARYNPVLHPSVQVNNYAEYMRDFLSVFSQDHSVIDGVAYLHNAKMVHVPTLLADESSSKARLFTGDRRSEFAEYLTNVFSADVPGSRAADAFLTSRVAPSKQLLTVAAREIQEQQQFVLLDEQRVAYQLVLGALEQARQADTKTVVLVSGGPGSGKSVIALTLLGELARRGYPVLHATGSRSFTQTLRKVAGHRKPTVQTLFKYFNSFIDAEKNSVEVLILDEAHRLREKSVNRYTPKSLRENARAQVDELLDTARVPVFLLDEHQIVRPGELGSVSDIRAAATRRSIPVLEVNLNAQYRSGGSKTYTDWVLALLGLQGTLPTIWEDEPNFSVRVVDSPLVMEQELSQKLTLGVNARMTVGYCWKWSNATETGLVDDVVIGD